MSMFNQYEDHLPFFGVSSLKQLYKIVSTFAKNYMGMDELSFTLSALENPPRGRPCPEIYTFIERVNKLMRGNNSDEEAKDLIQWLIKNPPKASYENPKLPTSRCTRDENFLIEHIFNYGIDLPGTKYNPYGKPGNYSNFFIDMFFGNYTEFMDHVKSFSSTELQRVLTKREGYCQFSPIFAPILGMRLTNLNSDPNFTAKEKREIRLMYSGNNENRNADILVKLLELGADPRAHSIHGYTPLHLAVPLSNYKVIQSLLSYGANPNSESRNGIHPLSIMINARIPFEMRIVDLLVDNNAKLPIKKHANVLRSSVEGFGSRDLAVKVRKAFPRGPNECEKCTLHAVKKCGACGLVFYCSPACQKLDWKLHKATSH